MSKIKNKLIKSTNSVMSWIFGDKPDEQYDYENAIYRIQMNEAHAEDLELKEKFDVTYLKTSSITAQTTRTQSGHTTFVCNLCQWVLLIHKL